MTCALPCSVCCTYADRTRPHPTHRVPFSPTAALWSSPAFQHSSSVFIKPTHHMAFMLSLITLGGRERVCAHVFFFSDPRETNVIKLN